MDIEEIHRLIVKYNNQQASPEEKKIVEEWFENIDGKVHSLDESELLELKHDLFIATRHKIETKINPLITKKRRLKLYMPLGLVAVISCVVYAGILFFDTKQNKPTAVSLVRNNGHEIKPGGNNAVLKLADGTEISLDEIANGEIAIQSGIKIVKSKDGEIVYNSFGSPFKNSQMNTITTPKGGQYHIVLSDGTQAWLNAGSSITFPTIFNEVDRKVTIRGEVYFEVAKNKDKPFLVSTGLSEIKVLGTHFNVNAYDDEESQKTTLLEGSIEIKTLKGTKLLKPGDQTSISKSSSDFKLDKVDDMATVIAWKNGYFQFVDADMPSLMRQISRWYNTDVLYNGQIPDKKFVGKIPRNLKVEKLIEMLSYSGINCVVKQNKIIVNPK